MAVVLHCDNVTVRGITYAGKGSQSANAVSSWSIASLSDPQMYNYYYSSSGYSISSITSNKTLYLHWYAIATDDTIVRNPYYIGQHASGYLGWVREDVFPYGTNTVTYVASGGDITPSNQTKKYGTNLAISSVAISRTGYTFNGWKSSKTGTVYAAGSTITDTEYTAYAWNGTPSTLTLTAQWTINSYTVTLNAKGGTIPATSGWTGSGSTATKSVNYNSTIGTLPTPTMTGYTFNGWFTASSGGTKVTSSTVITATTPLYAQWTLSTYTYTFNSNNGLPTAPQTVTRNNGQTIIKADGSVDGVTSPTRTGYIFLGWNTLTSATAKLTSITATGTYAKNMTFYAVWQKGTSTITISSVSVDARGSGSITFKVDKASGLSDDATDSVAIVVSGTTVATATVTNAQHGSNRTASFSGSTVAALTPNSMSGTITATTTTTVDGVNMGSNTASTTFTMTNAALTIGGTPIKTTEMNQTIKAWNLGKVIKGKSEVKISTESMTVSLAGSTISSVVLSGAVSATISPGGFVMWTPPSMGAKTFTVTVTDSRGQTASYSATLNAANIVDYEPPVPTITNVTYNQTDGTLTCDYSVALYGYGSHNISTMTFCAMIGTTSVIVDGSTLTATKTGAGNTQVTQTGQFNLPAGVLQGRTQYTASLNARDAFSSVTTLAGFVTTSGKPILDFYKQDAVSLFGYANTEGHAVVDNSPDGFTVSDEKTTDLTGDLYVGGDSHLQDVYIDVNESILAANADGKVIANGTVSIAQGGTSANTKNGAQNNLGLFIGNTDKPEVYFSSGHAGASLNPADNDLYAWEAINGTERAIPVEYGGTGAGQGEQALVNLGLLDPNTTVQNVPQIFPKYGGGGGGSIAGTLASHVFKTTLTTTSASSSSSITFAAGSGVSLSDSGTTLTIAATDPVKSTSGTHADAQPSYCWETWKFSSGLLVAMFSQQLVAYGTTSGWNLFGDLYYRAIENIPMPHTSNSNAPEFSTVPYVIAQTRGNWNLTGIQITYLAKDKINVWLWADTNGLSTASAIEADFIAIGRWK